MTHTSYPRAANPIESSSTMTPRPPTVDHLPNSGAQNTIGPSLLDSNTDLAAVFGANSVSSAISAILWQRAISLEESRGSFFNF
jgi:hypothetical protein